MKHFLVIPAVALLIFAASVACEPADEPVTPIAAVPSDITVEQVYARMEQALLAGDGEILHAKLIPEEIVFQMTPIPVSEFGELRLDQVWIDANAGVGRHEHGARAPGSDDSGLEREIQTSDNRRTVDALGRSSEHRATTCPNSDSAIIGLLLYCRAYQDTVALEKGEFHDSPAIVLVMQGESTDEDGTSHFLSKYFVDPSSFLPRGIESQVSTGSAAAGASTGSGRYEIEFVDRDSLADDFFDPAGIGFVATSSAPADNLRPEVKGMRVYWPGAEVDAGLDRSLVLQRAEVFPGEFSPGPRATLSYQLAVDPTPTPYRGVGIDEFPLDAEDKLKSGLLAEWSGADVTRESIPLADGVGELLRLPGRYGDLYLARIQYETTIVVVHDYLGPPPYTGRDAMLKVVAALRPYEK